MDSTLLALGFNLKDEIEIFLKKQAWQTFPAFEAFKYHVESEYDSQGDDFYRALQQLTVFIHDLLVKYEHLYCPKGQMSTLPSWLIDKNKLDELSSDLNRVYCIIQKWLLTETKSVV